MKVALVGPSEREELARLELRLEERDAETLRIDPRTADVRLTSDGAAVDGVDLGRVAAVYVADLGLPSPQGTDAASSARALRNSQRHLVVWESLCERLALKARVINPPRTWDLHGLKPWESEVYRASELPAPRTLATTDARALASLGAGRGAGWIQKGLVGGYGYTESFDPPADPARAVAELGTTARLVQERVAGENVRAFVAGGRVVGAAEVVASGLDSRKDTLRLRRIALPEDAARVAVAAAARFGLAFSAVDFMRDSASGAYLLLECNSAPFFVAFERLTGIPVSSALADLLVERQRRTPAS